MDLRQEIVINQITAVMDKLVVVSAALEDNKAPKLAAIVNGCISSFGPVTNEIGGWPLVDRGQLGVGESRKQEDLQAEPDEQETQEAQ